MKKKNVVVTIDGETKIMAEWCREIGVSESAVLQHRKRNGVTAEQAIRHYKEKAAAKMAADFEGK